MQREFEAARWSHLVNDEGGRPVGEVRFYISGAEAVISMADAPDHRDEGYGRRLICDGTATLLELSQVNTLDVYIKLDNTASFRAF